MQSAKIDFSKLLGFDVVSDEIADSVDFQSQTIGAKLGAKVGDKDLAVLDLPSEPSR